MSDALAAGREAFASRAWDDAHTSLAEADTENGLPLEDLEALATAAYLAGRDRESIEAWTRAHGEAVADGLFERAVRSAFWVGFGHIQRGEMAQGGGWMARANELVAEHGLDCAECGYLLVPVALMNLDAGEYDSALECFSELSRIADRFDDRDLRALGRLGTGQALVCLGRHSEGAERFDEVMVDVTAGAVSPVVAGVVYCGVIDACQQAFDIDRAHEWTRALQHWCDGQSGLIRYRGQCLVHRSQVLALHGEWGEALTEAEAARVRLSEPPHPAVGMAHYQLGELRRLRGDLPGAEDAYRKAQDCGRPPQPGLALLLLARGETDAAAAMIETAVLETTDGVAQAALLPALVEIRLTAGEADRAAAAADELELSARTFDSLFLVAASEQARGSVALARDDPAGALGLLRSACDRWRDLEIPFEAAKAQVLMARACSALGDRVTARLEADSAQRTFIQLGAAGALDAMKDAVDATSAGGSRQAISPRENQVLRRVARGMTNREIADDLFISVKTVERHLSNIFTKLDATNRASATAIAQARGLI